MNGMKRKKLARDRGSSSKRRTPMPEQQDLFTADLKAEPLGRNNVRVACEYCDTEEADHITKRELATLEKQGWQDVRQCAADPESVIEWWTHMGTCPECVAAETASLFTTEAHP